MSKWFAIKGPDGEFMSSGHSERNAWTEALIRCVLEAPLGAPLHNEWYKHDFDADCIAAVNALGYRCVEVNLVEVNTTTAGGGGEKGKP